MLETDQSLANGAVSKKVHVAGVKYLLTARRLANGWFGSWVCCGCGKRGVNGVLYSTPRSAFDLTAKNLGQHRCPGPSE